MDNVCDLFTKLPHFLKIKDTTPAPFDKRLLKNILPEI
jgi:hypothetical protein